MNFVVFRHACGDLRVKLGNLFFLPVVMPDPPEKCRHCDRTGGPRLMPNGDLCCIAGGIGETNVTTDDIRRFALEKWQHEHEMEALAQTAKAEREGEV